MKIISQYLLVIAALIGAWIASSCHLPSKSGKHQAWFAKHPEAISDGFDYPVGPPDASGYYNAQGFGENRHLGDDWNGVGGGDTDLGDTIYAVANGRVTQSEDLRGGWGRLVRLLHAIPGTGDYQLIESLYAHCDTLLVTDGDIVLRGQPIATIGTAHGRYLAHLHLEIRDEIDQDIGPGYSEDQSGHLAPSVFIDSH